MVVNPYQTKDTYKHKVFIPSRERIILWLKKRKGLISQKNLEKKFDIDNIESKQALRRRLRAMERDGQIIYTQNHCYISSDNLQIVTGKVIGHKNGYGFLRTETLKEDLWLSTNQMKSCIHGDIILAHVKNSDKKNRNAAKVLKILKPNNVLIIGRYYVHNKIKFVIPDDTRFNFKIFILSSVKHEIPIGSIVVVKLKKHSINNTKMQGLIIEILGKKMNTNLSIKIALRTHSIPHVWSQGVKEQLRTINNTQRNLSTLKNRVDLRHLSFFTIDDEDAKDFDDAIFCKKKINAEEGWDLWVAISDVSYYVQPNTELDKAAAERGTSIYFPSFVVPMLPEKISMDLCSLNPHQDRLCLICQMNISNKGELISYKHYEGIIYSHGRFTYDEIFKMWNGDFSLRYKYKNRLKEIDNLLHLQNIFKKYNVCKNGIYFKNVEPKFVLDSDFRIKKICQNIRNDAHKFIESCMILANVASSNFINKYDYPILFRNHDKPSKDNIINFRSFLKKLGLILTGGEIPKSVHYANLLKHVSNRPDYNMIQTMLLRSMKQAVYSADNCGHFGLALSSYVHFTSPIRRYPDLILHRIIKNILLKNNNTPVCRQDKHRKRLYNKNEIKKIGVHCSMTERRADEATRDVVDWLKCDFMNQKIGDVLTGVISNVTSFGFFVRLSQFFIDGLVHVTSLRNDYYYFDAVGLKLVGRSGKYIYCLGDVLKVKVVSVNVVTRKIELSLYTSC
ncbi:MAG: ribonuclease R [Buchnera aphidicola (Pentalonia nigronervosa)]|uniref:Ribonuclease R n=1 Tax=Buchnera aphidicola (Pentalonia nigronervosa) TaxID=1309793 RepID=A0A7H1AZ26_9GAMM|nr:MAG: ribonuclease R [Buchnera aphidicola (Pentalonia nigronervosa)]